VTSERATQDQLERADPLIGTEIASRYRIVGRLGEGGMGVVYEGVHEALGRSVAIKILRPAWASDSEAIERFFREARTAAGLGHPNICDVYDLGRLENERPYMVMPKLEGNDLGKLVQEGGPIPPARVLELLRGPASALDTLHKRGLVHRDLKPENLVLGTLEDGQEIVRLVDFGLATLADGRDSRLTREGFVCETCKTGAATSTRSQWSRSSSSRELCRSIIPTRSRS
jgi:serine/threonine-protein kinase